MSVQNGLTINWQSIAVISALAVSVTTFSVQLGGVQTQVAYNTKALDETMVRQRGAIEKIAKLDDTQKQIDTITDNIERRRTELASKTELQQALNTTRAEFLSEIRRLDEKSSHTMNASTFLTWRQERDLLISQILKRLELLESRK